MADLPTYEEVLVMLSEKATSGSVSATIALERALRPHDHGADVNSEIDAELERLLKED